MTLSYTIYKVTNILTKRIFIGYYTGSTPLDKIQLKQSDLSKDEKSLGKENFKRTILFTFFNKEDMKAKYKEIVNRDFFNKHDTYNRNIFNKVPVKDKNGNIFLKDKSDPKFHEYTCINKGMVTVKDKNGKNFQVSVDDPLYVNRTYVHVNQRPPKLKPPKKIRIKKPPKKRLSASEAQIVYRTKLRAKKYPNFNFPIIIKNKLFFIENFCEHGNLNINQDFFEFIYFKNNNNLKLYCDKCREEYLNNLNISNEDLVYNRNILKGLYKKGSSSLKKEYIKKYHFVLYKCIINNSDVLNWNERVFLFKEELKEPKTCLFDNCQKKTKFSPSNQSYNFFCETHVNSYKSKGEIELLKYIQSIYDGEVKKLKIDKKELDIYLPEKNLALEFNGLYWHNEKFKDKKYHYNKWKYCKDKNIHLITVWEDDWNFKKDIIKSIINNQLNLSSKIYARKCLIKEVKKDKIRKFLINNHLQGFVPSSIKLGLYYNDELVSLMTFGKRKISGKSYYELLRFCSKLNTSVIGGASRLFKNFLLLGHKNIISYASCDISNGSLYKILGFNEIGHTGVNYWWSNNINKYHRSNFMKYKLVKDGANFIKTENEIMHEKGFYKIYGTGNLKYEYINKIK